MCLELAGGGAAWLAHVLWYVTASTRSRAVQLPVWLEARPLLMLCRSLAVLLLVCSICFLVRQHGPALGACAALAALMAAGSVNSVLAPLSLRSFAVSMALGACIFALGTWGWLRGA